MKKVEVMISMPVESIIRLYEKGFDIEYIINQYIYCLRWKNYKNKDKETIRMLVYGVIYNYVMQKNL